VSWSWKRLNGWERNKAEIIWRALYIVGVFGALANEQQNIFFLSRSLAQIFWIFYLVSIERFNRVGAWRSCEHHIVTPFNETRAIECQWFTDDPRRISQADRSTISSSENRLTSINAPRAQSWLLCESFWEKVEKNWKISHFFASSGSWNFTNATTKAQKFRKAFFRVLCELLSFRRKSSRLWVCKYGKWCWAFLWCFKWN
jgi:hypothetical protein